MREFLPALTGLWPTCSTVRDRVRPAYRMNPAPPGALSAPLDGTRRDRPGDSKRPPGSLGRVAFETNCRSIPVPFALLLKRTARSLVPDAPSFLILVPKTLLCSASIPETGSAGTVVPISTLISIKHTRSVCGEVASGSVSRQGERIRSSDNSYKIFTA